VTSSAEEPPENPRWPLTARAPAADARDAGLELRVATAAARAGGQVLRRYRRGGDLGVAYKDGRANLVTSADTASQRAVVATIRTAFPGHTIVGEEGTAPGLDQARVWYVDPLDGTTNFVHELPFYCVSVALREHGRTVAGAVYDPVHDEMYAAEAGHGATVNGAPLRVSVVDRLDRALIVAQAQTVVPAQIDAYARLVTRLMSVSGGVRSLGSPALTLCAIAAGRLDAYCEHTMDAWDIVAGQLILQQAGGTLTLFDGRPHDTTDRADVIASNGHIPAELISSLRGLS